MNTLNSNLKSLLRHAAMVGGIGFDGYKPFEFQYGYNIIDTNNQTRNCFIYIPMSFRGSIIRKNYVTTPCTALYSEVLLNNINSLLCHYLKYYNLPKPYMFIFNFGNIYRCLPDTSRDSYAMDHMIYLPHLVGNSHYNFLYSA